jgi:hypothetical protein
MAKYWSDLVGSVVRDWLMIEFERGWSHCALVACDRTGQRRARLNPTLKFATSLPVFGCCARGTSKRLREMALVGKTCLERDTRNGLAAT